MSRSLLVLVLLSLIIFSNVVNANFISADSVLSSEKKPREIIINTKMPINLVMIGDTWSDQDKVNITDKLLKTYSPPILSENRTAGVTYNYKYNFDSVSQETADKLFKFINSTAVENPMPPPIKQWINSKQPEFWGPDFVKIPKMKYKLIDANQVDDWLFRNLELQAGYTIYFLKPSGNQTNYFHTYGIVTQDPDTKANFVEEGMMGFGGKHRFYFIDLRAGPWYYPYLPVSQDQVFAQFHKNLYEVKTDEDYYAFIANYVNDAITLLFTPSYLYSPIYRSNFMANVFLVDMTSGRTFRDISGNFIDRSTITNALTQLVPYAKWSIDITGQTFDVLPRELQRSILKSLSFRQVPSGSLILVKSSDLILELNKWVASNLSQEQRRLAQEEAATTVFVPAVVFVFDTSAYVDQIPVIGTAVSDPNDQTVPCCAVVAVDKHALSDLNSGLSALVIHEMGHVLGLRHPHDGYDPTKGEFEDWFFDWSYTPMSYSSPTGLGCGLLSTPCGLVIPEFGQFNHDALDRGLVLNLLNQAQLNVYNSTISLEKKGYRESNLPGNITSMLSSIDLDVQKSIERFTDMNYFNHTNFDNAANLTAPRDDSFGLALKALTTSEQLLKKVSSLEYSPTAKGTSTIVASEPSFVDKSGNELAKAEVGKTMEIKTRISNNIDQNMTFTYLVQIKDSDDFTLFLAWQDGITVKPRKVVEPAIAWIPDTSGKLKVEIFVWRSIENPVPLSQVKSTTLAVTA